MNRLVSNMVDVNLFYSIIIGNNPKTGFFVRLAIVLMAVMLLVSCSEMTKDHKSLLRNGNGLQEPKNLLGAAASDAEVVFAQNWDFFDPTRSAIITVSTEDNGNGTYNITFDVSEDNNSFIYRTGYYKLPGDVEWQDFVFPKQNSGEEWSQDWVKNHAQETITVDSFDGEGNVAVFVCKEYNILDLLYNPVVSLLSSGAVEVLLNAFNLEDYRYFCGLKNITLEGLDENNWILSSFGTNDCVSSCTGSESVCVDGVLKECQEVESDCWQLVTVEDCGSQGKTCDEVLGCIDQCVDVDGDGYNTTTSCGPIDCADDNPAIHPGASEICTDHTDDDCDGLADCNDPDCSSDPVCQEVSCQDNDNDNYYAQEGCGSAADCNDSDSSVNPGADEICGDSIDNNCDGTIDEGCDCQLLNTKLGPGLFSSFILPSDGKKFWLLISDGSNQRGTVKRYLTSLDGTVINETSFPKEGYELLKVLTAVPVPDGALAVFEYSSPSIETISKSLRVVRLDKNLDIINYYEIDPSAGYPQLLFKKDNDYWLLITKDFSVLILKFSADGDYLGVENLTDSGQGYYSEYALWNNGLYVSGKFFDTEYQDWKTFIRHWDQSGSEVFFKKYSFSSYYPKLVASNGNTYAYFADKSNNLLSIAKIDPTTGSLIDRRSFDGVSGVFNDYAEVLGGDIFIAGKINYTDYYGNYLFARMTPDLDLVWSYMEPYKYSWFTATDEAMIDGNLVISFFNTYIRIMNPECGTKDVPLI